MTVCPNGLNPVTTDADNLPQLKSRRRQFRFRIFIHVPQNIRLTLATGARTTPPQFLQRNKTFAAVIPFHGEFISDLLNVRRAH